MTKSKKQPTTQFVAAGYAAESLGACSDTLRRWARAGKIDFMRTPGGRYRYNLDGFMAAQGKGAPVKSAAVAVKAVAPVAMPVAAAAAPVVVKVETIVKPAPLSAAQLVAALVAAPSGIMKRDEMPTLGASTGAAATYDQRDAE